MEPTAGGTEQQPARASRASALMARRWSRGMKALVALIMVGATVIAAIGFTGSYTAVRTLAEHKGFSWFSNAFPVGVDVGIVVMLALDVFLTWCGMAFAPLRYYAWLLTGATIVFNASVSWPDKVGSAMHAVIPLMFVIVVEAARHVVQRIADIADDRHMDSIRWWRWVLAPIGTFRMWRRMKLWEIRSYGQVVELERDRKLYRRELRDRYGRHWRKLAPSSELRPLRLAAYGLRAAALSHTVDSLRGEGAVASDLVVQQAEPHAALTAQATGPEQSAPVVAALQQPAAPVPAPPVAPVPAAPLPVAGPSAPSPAPEQPAGADAGPVLVSGFETIGRNALTAVELAAPPAPGGTDQAHLAPREGLDPAPVAPESAGSWWQQAAAGASQPGSALPQEHTVHGHAAELDAQDPRPLAEEQPAARAQEQFSGPLPAEVPLDEEGGDGADESMEEDGLDDGLSDPRLTKKERARLVYQQHLDLGRELSRKQLATLAGYEHEGSARTVFNELLAELGPIVAGRPRQDQLPQQPEDAEVLQMARG